MFRRALRSLAALSLLAFASGAQAQAISYVVLKDKTFYVELAETEAAQARGLMFREHLAADRGMFFIFRDEDMRAFWMKNCFISLDILYFDKRFQLVSAQTSVPPCKTPACPSYPSSAPAMYVLELAAGTADRLGLKPGDKVEFHR